MLMINRITDELLAAAGRRPASGATPRTPQEIEQDGIGNQIKHYLAESGNFVATHPGASLAAALGVGILLGWWVKRT